MASSCTLRDSGKARAPWSSDKNNGRSHTHVDTTWEWLQDASSNLAASTIMTEIEKAYIAGIIDGEGSICIERRANRKLSTPAVYVASIDRELLDWLGSLLGGHICKKRPDAPHHSQSWDWKLRGDKALELLEAVRPFLRIRRKQRRAAMLCLRWKELTPRNGRYSEQQRARKEEFIQRFIAGGNDDGNNEATKAARVRGDVTGEAARDRDEGWPSRA